MELSEILFLFLGKNLKISAFAFHVRAVALILRLQGTHSWVHRQTLPYFGGIYHLILEKVVWGLLMLEWWWWSADQKWKKTVIKGPTTLFQA